MVRKLRASSSTSQTKILETSAAPLYIVNCISFKGFGRHDGIRSARPIQIVLEGSTIQAGVV